MSFDLRQVQTGRADADLAKGFQGTIMEQQIRKYDYALFMMMMMMAISMTMRHMYHNTFLLEIFDI